MCFTAYLAPFSDHPVLQERVLYVLESLPREVQRDFLDDRRFQITLDNFHPERGWSFLMPAPGVSGSGSRCIVLRLKLADASEPFAWYVIAHEFAHAYLRNGGWGEITDIEEAADAMAGTWGFKRPNPTRLILFTDLDGCLLNKHDYDWSAAAPTLQTLRARHIPVILNSSKTVPEMRQLASELGLAGNTFISENGSVICWGDEIGRGQFDSPSGKTEFIGASRDVILEVLKSLKSKFHFRSFADLGIDGVIGETQLSHDKAKSAMARQGTEPLLWDDSDEHRSQFEQALHSHQLTLTKGGRFWHVAGQTSKGDAMRRVAQRLSYLEGRTMTAAIGDSPIDQSMLDAADVPIGIPTAAGLGVTVDPGRGILPQQQGAAGWAEAVTELLSRIDKSASKKSRDCSIIRLD